jgi:hypothetical protein
VVRSRHHDYISLHLRVNVAEDRVYARSTEPMAPPLPRGVCAEIKILSERVGAKNIVKQRIAVSELDFLTRKDRQHLGNETEAPLVNNEGR